MAVRSVVVKKPLKKMMEERFPDFPYAGEWQGAYAFVRKRPGYWYDYLCIDRIFEDGKGAIEICWPWCGTGFNPDFYAWSTGDKWRIYSRIHCDYGDRFGPPQPQTKFHGPNQPVRYQNGAQAFLDQALEVMAEKIEQYAVPELEELAKVPLSSELKRWQCLAEQIMPQIEALERQDPEEFEALRAWQKQKARRWRESVDEGVPPLMLRWREEIKQLPGFAEEWDKSPILREWVFSWFTHALMLRP